MTAPRYTFDVLGELFYGKMFGFMGTGIDVGGYMKAIESLLPAFTIGGTLPSYLTNPFLLSTILMSPAIRGALSAVQKIEDASRTAVEQRKREWEQFKSSGDGLMFFFFFFGNSWPGGLTQTTTSLETNQDVKRDILRKILEINSEKGEKIDFTYQHIYVESHSSMYVCLISIHIYSSSIIIFCLTRQAQFCRCRHDSHCDQ